jgi:transposase-like protein
MKTTYNKTLISEVCGRILEGRETVISLSREYGISRNTMYSWMSRYRKDKIKLYQDEQVIAIDMLRQENGALLEKIEELSKELAYLRKHEKAGRHEILGAGCASHIALKPCDTLYIVRSVGCINNGCSINHDANKQCGRRGFGEEE